MANTTFNTRIVLKHDTYANWVSKDPVLLNGEIAVVVVPASTGAVTNEPAVLFKVGDGTKTFTQLPFTAGLAADVHSWAKAENKPTYSAKEITGLSDYISGQIQDTNTTYKIVVDTTNPRKFTLQSQEKGTTNWTTVSTVTIPDETVYTLAEGSTNGTVKFNGTDISVHGLGSAAYKDESAFVAAGSLDSAIAEAKKAGTDAQSAVDELEGYVGTLPVGATSNNVVDYISEKINAIPEPTDYKVTVTASTPEGVAKRYNIKQTASNLDVNIDIPKDMVVASGTVETKTTSGAWGEPGTYLHLVLANATEDDIYIDVGNLIEYVTSGSSDSDQVIINIDNDHKVTATLSSSVQAAIGKAHEHSNITELNKIASGDKANWDAAYDAKHAHNNKTVLDGITSDKVANWDTAHSNSHTHSNKTVLDGITSAKVTEWDGKADANHNHDIANLQQASGYIIFDCGTATENIG